MPVYCVYYGFYRCLLARRAVFTVFTANLRGSGHVLCQKTSLSHVYWKSTVFADHLVPHFCMAIRHDLQKTTFWQGPRGQLGPVPCVVGGRRFCWFVCSFGSHISSLPSAIFWIHVRRKRSRTNKHAVGTWLTSEIFFLCTTWHFFLARCLEFPGKVSIGYARSRCQ